MHHEASTIPQHHEIIKRKGNQGIPRTTETQPIWIKMESQQNESRIKACKVCFTSYDIKDRRPRVLFCGHTFCSRCVTDNLKEKKVACPTCRREHQATSSSDFPVNYELESVLQEDPTSGQLGSEDNSIPFCDDVSRGISKKLRSIRQELSSDIEGLRTKCHEACSQLHQYKSQLMEWKEEHHKNLKVYRGIVHQHEDVITCIHKECLRVDEAIGMGNEETQKIKIASDNLVLARTTNEVMPAFEEADLCYDVLDTWTQKVHKHFPDNKLIAQSKKLTERSKSGLRKFSVSLDKEDSVPTASASQCQDMTSPVDEKEVSQDDMSKEKGLVVSLEIQEKIRKTLDSIPTDQINQCSQTDTTAVLEVQDLVNMTPLAKNLLKAKKVYAVKVCKGKEGMQYARITLNQNQLCLHVLGKPKYLPEDAFFIQYDELRKLVDPSSRLTFLELGVEGRSLGTLRIRLFKDTKSTQQFSLLCTGEMGPSYADSNILSVSYKGSDEDELVNFGDYESNNGYGGKAILPGVDWEKEQMNNIPSRPWVVGSVFYRFGNEENAAQFSITTSSWPKCMYSWNFGLVEEGMSILTEAVSQHPDIKKCFIKDCGIVLKLTI